MKGHTPGPWLIEEPGDFNMDEGILILANNAPPNERLVAECLSGEGSGERMKADARLIAAAPEMEKELRDLYEWLDGFADGAPDSDPVYREATRRAESVLRVLAKATREEATR